MKAKSNDAAARSAACSPKVRVVFDMDFDPKGKCTTNVTFSLPQNPAIRCPESIQGLVIGEIKMLCGAMAASGLLAEKEPERSPLPCPFCGSTPQLEDTRAGLYDQSRRWTDPEWWMLRCTDQTCNAWLTAATKEAVTNKWNRRPIASENAGGEQ